MKILSVSVLHCILSYLHFLKLVSHTCAHIDILLLCLIKNLALNWKNSLDYIYYLVSSSLLPIAVLSWSCCPVSELAALVRAFDVDFLLLYPAPCRRDSLFSTSKKVVIFLIMLGCGWIFVVHGMHFVNWVVLSLLNMWVPCIDVTFTSTSTTSMGSLHLKNLCGKLHSGWSRQAILSTE